MGSIGRDMFRTPMGAVLVRYMFRTTMGAFLITLITLTVVMWFTQAIREFDLITSQRQTLFVFIGITGLLIPLLVMEKGSVQRMEAGQLDPRIVTFDRYAFDLSKFGVGPQTTGVTYNTREKYIWELIWPPANDALFLAQPGEYRSELHDRIATPLYPIAFVVLSYAFLGPPQTTRQSRTLSLLALVGVVAVLRLVGFLSVIIGTHMPGALAAQYVALLGAIAAGSWQISRG